MKIINISKHFLFMLLLLSGLFSAGKVYLVLGSDTAIWWGMNVAQFDNLYRYDLYTDPLDNAYHVMDPTWRNQLVDSYGTPMKLTWWMMGGNIFRYARNNNVPLNNTMTLYLMQKYHGNAIEEFGDELSIHYHTFKWTDYDQDNVYWWNQSLTFAECEDDWNTTLAQYLIEENVFPVSFRSGWHYMDNHWQDVLNEWVPYSMHNDWPADRIDDTEPLDNTFHWGDAPSDWIPSQPSGDNYQLPGGNRGWNVRSAHFNSVRYDEHMDEVFSDANDGEDQVACFWGHLPEDDFITNLEIMDSLAHQAQANYPDVEFMYCTAVEAMQLWLGSTDTTGPEVSMDVTDNGNNIGITISVDEPLFMHKPFLAIKDRYEQYHTVFDLTIEGENAWIAELNQGMDDLGTIAIAATDTSGNLTIVMENYIPKDLFIDNLDQEYIEIRGNWSQNSSYAWGTDSRSCTISPGDSAIVEWTWSPEQVSLYNIFVQTPEAIPDDLDSKFTLQSQTGQDTTIHIDNSESYFWNYISTINITSIDNITIRQTTLNNSTVNATIYADALKASAYIRDQDIECPTPVIALGEVSQSDTLTVDFSILNQGIETLTISSFDLTSGAPPPFTQELIIEGMSQAVVPLTFYFDETGGIVDTLIIQSNDPIDPTMRIPITGEVTPYFIIIDNEDFSQYSEYGEWHTSVAQAYGPSSRYAWLNSGNWASFNGQVLRSGLYSVFEIVPTTVNSTDNAEYRLYVDDTGVDTVIINQNSGSGNWVYIGQFEANENSTIRVDVIDPGGSTEGVVLRADAIKVQLTTNLSNSIENTLPLQYSLGNPYPNPFNATLTIPWSGGTGEPVSIVVYDLLGKRTRDLLVNESNPGENMLLWDGRNNSGTVVSTGAYYIIMVNKDHIPVDRKKVLLLK